MGKLQEELKRFDPLLIDHFMNPRNVGELPDATAKGGAENPWCQDVVRYALRIQAGRVEAIRMKVFGCTVAIASASAVTELAQGRTVKEAGTLGSAELFNALGGVPEDRRRCTTAALAALKRALEQVS
jgi:nitrogen fixation NifU-like protein